MLCSVPASVSPAQILLEYMVMAVAVMENEQQRQIIDFVSVLFRVSMLSYFIYDRGECASEIS